MHAIMLQLVCLALSQPPSHTGGEQPPWMRMLTGDDAKQVAELENKLTELLQQGKFDEAIEPAQQVADLRERAQGKSHWEAKDARRYATDVAALPQNPHREQLPPLWSISAQAEALKLKGAYREAMPHFERLVAICRAVWGEEHFTTAMSYSNLAMNFQALGDYPSAIQYAQKAVAIHRQSVGEEHPQMGRACNDLGGYLQSAGRLAEAWEWLQKGLEIRRKTLGDRHSHTAESYMNTATNLQARDKHLEAEQMLVKALAVFQETLGDDHYKTAHCHYNLANNQYSLGKFDAAAHSSIKAISILEKVLGDSHPETATAYSLDAGILQRQGKYVEAEQRFLQVLSIYSKSLGDDYPLVAQTHLNLAVIRNALGKHDLAEQDLRRSLQIRLKRLGEKHSQTASSYLGLGHFLFRRGRYLEATQAYHKALEIQRDLLGDDHPSVALIYGNIAGSLKALGKFAESEEWYQRALVTEARLFGAEHPRVGMAHNNLGACLVAQGRIAEAEELSAKALAIFRKSYGEDHVDTALGYNNVATIRSSRGKYTEAAEDLQKALAIYRKRGDHPDTASVYTNLGYNLKMAGRLDEAESAYRSGLQIWRKFGEGHPRIARGEINLAKCLESQGKYAEAAKGFQTALRILQNAYQEDHPDIALTYALIAYNLAAQGKPLEAEEPLAKSVAMQHRVRAWSSAQGLGRSLAEQDSDRELRYADLLAANGKMAAAAQALEDSLGRGLLDDLAGRQRAIPEEHRVRRRELIHRLGALTQLVELNKDDSGSGPDRNFEQLKREQLNAKLALLELEREWEKMLGPAVGKPLALTEIQQAIPKDAALVAWVDLTSPADPHDGMHWAFLLRAEGEPAVVKIDDARGESGLAATALWGVVRNPKVPVPPDRLAQLAQGRFASLSKHLAATGNLPTVRQLIVLPSSLLAGIPVELLAPPGLRVSYAPSGSLFAYLKGLAEPRSDGLLAYGDPVYETTQPRERQPVLPPGGVLITQVVPKGNAARHGLLAGDVLLSYDETELLDPAGIAIRAEGEQVIVRVWRSSSQAAPQIRELRVEPGALGVALAKESAPAALRARRKEEESLWAVRSGREEFPPLPGSLQEVQRLRERFDSAHRPVLVRIGVDAAEQALAKAAARDLKHYRVLHFATHGVIDNQRPSRSAIVLSQVELPDPAEQFDNGLPIYDGKITVEEIVENWELDADLVVLSACETALGRQAGGEGFIGFAQALLTAGARSVVLSLWKVDDMATALLMDRFYGNLLGQTEGLDKPMPKAEALSEAKRWLREMSSSEVAKYMASMTVGVDRGKGRVSRLDPNAPLPKPAGPPEGEKPYAHPYYWAAFILIGDPD